MDFSMTPEQLALREATLEFGPSIGGNAEENDRNQTFDIAGWRACARFGVLGWPVPTEYGGSGYDALTTMIGCEALGYACADNGLVFAVDNHLWACVIYVLLHGSPAQKARFLPGLTDGSVIGAHALTEPQVGSDVLSLATKARRDGDKYFLNGRKVFISNGPCADLYVVFARTGDEHVAAQGALSAFLVPRDSPGLRVQRSIGKAGLRATPMGEIVFDECEVGADALLGRAGAGYQIFTSTIEWERGFMAASQVGRLARILDSCLDYVAERKQFGRPIGSYQAVSHRLADVRTSLELARLMLYKVGWLKTQGRLALLESAIVKLHTSESLLASAITAMRVHGARGYVTDLPIEREVRDALGGPVYGGTSDIQRNIIASLSGVPGMN
jgi:alkylation response protein AidB-like acyl-CoA dehydrogenase